jgi:hypothetical protein
MVHHTSLRNGRSTLLALSRGHRLVSINRWTYIDVVLVPVALILAISLSCALAFTKSAPERMSRLVYWFYDHRMHQ